MFLEVGGNWCVMHDDVCMYVMYVCMHVYACMVSHHVRSVLCSSRATTQANDIDFFAVGLSLQKNFTVSAKLNLKQQFGK